MRPALTVFGRSSPLPRNGQIIMGGYSGPDDTTDEGNFLESIGASPPNSCLIEYMNGGSLPAVSGSSTWTDAFNTTNNLQSFAAWTGPKCYSICPQVAVSPLTWTDVTGGSQDANFTTLAQWLYAANCQNIRIGWEMNGDWFAWGCANADTATNQAGFRNTWIHIWNLFNAVAPGYFKYWFNPAGLQASPGMTDLYTNYYPGDQYVDYIGLDVYNQWQGGSATMAQTITFDVNAADAWTAPPGVSTVSVTCGTTTNAAYPVTPGTTYAITRTGSATTFNGTGVTGAAGNCTLGYTYNPGVVGGVSLGVWQNTMQAMSPTQMAATAAQMKSVGMTYVRFDCPYQTGAVSGPNDTAIVACQTAGLIPIIILEDWESGTAGNFGSAWATFCGNATTHYKSLLGAGVVYELSNEVNQNYAWIGGTVTPATYAAGASLATTAIKAVDSTAIVLMSGLAAGNAYTGSDSPTTNSMSCLDFINGCYGHWAGTSPVDALNVHPYTYSALGDGDTNGGYPAEVSAEWNTWNELAGIYATMSSNGDGAKKIWGTEYGVPVGQTNVQGVVMTAAMQATSLALAFQLWASLAYTGPFLTFNWIDSTDGDYGLYTSGGTARPILSIYEAGTIANSSPFPGDSALYTALLSGAAPNWNSTYSFAQSHSKGLCIPEFGLVPADSQSPGDDATFVSNIMGLAISSAKAGFTIFACPYNGGGSLWSDYPDGFAELQTQVALGISDGLIIGGGSIIRSAASGFPLWQDYYPGTSPSIPTVTWGNEGDEVVVTNYLAANATTSSVTTTPEMGFNFQKLGSYYDSTWPGGGFTGATIEQWYATVPAAAAGQTCSITAALVGSSTYTSMVVDEFVSSFGNRSAWSPGAINTQLNSTSTSVDFPNVLSQTTSDLMMYYGYAQLNSGISLTGGTNPINGLTFTYTPVPSSSSLLGVVFNGAIAPTQNYQPVGTASATTISQAIAATWEVVQGSITVNSIPNQSGVVGTAFTYTVGAYNGVNPYSYTATGLPPGLSMNGAKITGTPTGSAASYTVTVKVTDASGAHQSTSFTFTITGSGTPVPNAPSTISGITVPTNVVFDDEFPGPTLNTSLGWQAITASSDNGTPMSPSNVSFGANGIQLLMNSNGTGAFVTTGTQFFNTSGPGFTLFPTASKPVYVEYKANFPLSGSQTANWAAVWLSSVGWGTSGYSEIDVAECLSGKLCATVHYSSTATQSQAIMGGGGAMHTYGVLWTTTHQYYVLDGVVTGSTAIALANPCGINLEQADGSDGGPQLTGVYLMVRYVRAWQ